MGAETIDDIMCEGSVEVLVDSGSGVPLALGPHQMTPQLRRFAEGRDGGCVIDRCTISHRF